MAKDNRNADLERKLKLFEGQIKRNPDNGNNYSLKAEVLMQLGQRTNNTAYYEQALDCYNKAISIVPDNSDYLSDRSKLHALMGNNELAARDITEGQKSSNSGKDASVIRDMLNMYSTHTTKDILKLDGVQKEVARMIEKGELPPELSAVFSEMIGVITGISARVSEHDGRLNEHDERFEKDEARLKEVEERLAEYDKQYPALNNIMESMKAQIGILQSQLSKQDDKVKVHGKMIISLQQASKIAEKVMEDLQEKAEKAQGASSAAETDALKKELKVLSASVKELFSKVSDREAKFKEQDPLIDELVSTMESLKAAKELNMKMLVTIRGKLKVIEEKANSPQTNSEVGVGIVSDITYDNELLNYPDLFIKTAKLLGAETAIELGRGLSSELVAEAANIGDPLLVLAGMMSLDYGDH